MCETPFCVSLLCFGGQNPSLVFNQRQLVEAIFAGICVCTSVWEAAASLHRDSPLEWAQFLAKTETNSWHRVVQLFFSTPPPFDHMPESQEASELFVGLSHISGLTLRCLRLLLNYLRLIYFNGADLLKTLKNKTKTLGRPARMCQYAKSHRVLFCLEVINVSQNLGRWRLAVMKHPQLLALSRDFEPFPGTKTKNRTRRYIWIIRLHVFLCGDWIWTHQQCKCTPLKFLTLHVFYREESFVRIVIR